MKPLLALLCALTAFAACAQSAYRWVDKDGKVHYTDEPPPASVQKFDQRKLGGNVIDSGGKLPYETRQAARDFPLTVYTTPECGNPCTSALAFLRQRAIPFTEKSIKTADDAAAFRKTAGGTDLTIPTLAVGTKLQRGFEATAWSRVLEIAGYPLGK